MATNKTRYTHQNVRWHHRHFDHMWQQMTNDHRPPTPAQNQPGYSEFIIVVSCVQYIYAICAAMGFKLVAVYAYFTAVI